MSTFTTNLNLEEPLNGADVNTWDVPLNGDLTIIDAAMGSSTTQAFTNVDVTLSVAQSAYFMIVCTGTLTGNVKLILPGTIGGGRYIFNQTGGAFTLTVLNGAGDTGGGVICGQGYQTSVVLTAGRAYYDAYAAIPPGTTLPFAGAAPPPGFLLCFGQVVSQTTYAALFATLGTTWGPATGGNFTLPDYRGRVLAGADNMGGSAAGNLIGYVVGTTGGNQAVTLGVTQIPAHTHGFTGTTGNDSPDHTHNSLQSAGAAVSPGGATGFAAAPTSQATTGANSRHQHPFSGTTDNGTGGGLGHPNVQPTAAVNIMIRF